MKPVILKVSFALLLVLALCTLPPTTLSES